MVDEAPSEEKNPRKSKAKQSNRLQLTTPSVDIIEYEEGIFSWLYIHEIIIQ